MGASLEKSKHAPNQTSIILIIKKSLNSKISYT